MVFKKMLQVPNKYLLSNKWLNNKDSGAQGLFSKLSPAIFSFPFWPETWAAEWFAFQVFSGLPVNV